MSCVQGWLFDAPAAVEGAVGEKCRSLRCAPVEMTSGRMGSEKWSGEDLFGEMGLEGVTIIAS